MNNRRVPIVPAVWGATKGIPAYLVGYFAGLYIALVTDVNVTTFALAGVCAGLATQSVLIGLIVFLGIHSFARTLVATRGL
jgi:hypothetical protein